MVGGLQTVGERTFAGTRGNGEVAPIPDIPALDLDPGRFDPLEPSWRKGDG